MNKRNKWKFNIKIGKKLKNTNKTKAVKEEQN